MTYLDVFRLWFAQFIEILAIWQPGQSTKVGAGMYGPIWQEEREKENKKVRAVCFKIELKVDWMWVKYILFAFQQFYRRWSSSRLGLQSVNSFQRDVLSVFIMKRFIAVFFFVLSFLSTVVRCSSKLSTSEYGNPFQSTF